ncbi:lariat debranching enzyme-like isoform X1 [Diorhabda carinulata]|uniref:lariat debranching enzyme-like isoform X1 n=1 Tax=Diorhabda carinulata TaxID=1163345 RepID=UPI00259FF826|nr:lariat debranching enzyme-like isoform X1 [Diorhabda carinulata]
MKIAVEGCAHGDLEKIYDSIYVTEQTEGIKVDLLVCCGDFQSSRNEDDLMCMAVPPKYQRICTFYKYYSGELLAPVLTIFIGGNHEASNYLQELPYGGWVAPNIYYLGYAGVINIGDLRIAGISGIYKSADYMKGHFEKPPYSEQSKRSIYHIRNLEVFRLKQLSEKIDIMLSHDWPSDVYKYGNVEQLLKKKPHFKIDIEKGVLGSKPSSDLMYHLKPSYWFSAHLHCKYSAIVKHQDDSVTRFLSLDKCLPKRNFLEIIDFPHDNSKLQLSYDLEWLTILYLTNHLLCVENRFTFMPEAGDNERYEFTPTDNEKDLIFERLNGNLVIPKLFSKTASAFNPNSPSDRPRQPEPVLNPQTISLCEKLYIDDPLTKISKINGTYAQLNSSIDLNSTISFLDDSIESSSPFGTPVKKLIFRECLGDVDEEPDIDRDKNSIECNQNQSSETVAVINSKKTVLNNYDCNSPTKKNLERKIRICVKLKDGGWLSG